MTGKQISVIYFYLVSAAALALIVVGVFNSVNFLINSTQFKDYPLDYWEANCESYPYKGRPMPVLEADVASLSAEEMETQKRICEEQVADQRQQKKINDLKSSVTYTLVGLVLFVIHFPQARKQSSN